MGDCVIEIVWAGKSRNVGWFGPIGKLKPTDGGDGWNCEMSGTLDGEEERRSRCSTIYTFD